MERLKPAEYKLKDIVFGLIRPFLKRGRPEIIPIDGARLRRVLFIRPDKLGDMVISLPVMDGLKVNLPNVKISIIASPFSIPIIKDDPRFERLFLYRKNIIRDVREVIRIRKMKFDCVVDLICDDSLTSLFLSQLCVWGRPRIALGKTRLAGFYDFNYDYQKDSAGHMIDNTKNVLVAFGIDPETVTGHAPPYIDPDSEKTAREFMSDVNGHNHDSLIVGYNLSAGKPSRVWSPEKGRELLRRILDYRPDCRIVLLTTPHERYRAEKMKQHFNERVFLVPDKLNIVQASAMIKCLDLLITPDTSLVHIARAFKVPVVGLYPKYMRNFHLWQPYRQSDGAVVSENKWDIFAITPEDVFSGFVNVLKGRKIVSCP